MALSSNFTNTRQDGKFSKSVENSLLEDHKTYEQIDNKKKKVTKMTLAIPNEYAEDVNIACLYHNRSKTAYINSLIKKDLEENIEKYREVAKMINNG